MDTQGQLEAHEQLCLERYKGITDKLDALDKRMWRLEAMVMLSSASIIVSVVALFMRG
jgi:hypothetical protein